MERTRLAPSPTGALHLGNARTFVINWALARRRDWHIVLRIDDLDGPRVKPDVSEQIIDTLSWLGLDWDEGPIFQSPTMSTYERAMSALASRSRVYPCALTRTQIEQAATAPHAGEHETVYPASLRPDACPSTFDDAGTNWRLAVDDGRVTFDDAFHGVVALDVAASVGDFVVWTKRAQPSYQLAVVVDDDAQGITQVVRGDDLLDSTARQLLLYRALDLTTVPEYLHLPLVVGPDGRRLAKRHGDTRVDAYREAGVAPERILALLARWSGQGQPDRISAEDFAAGLDLARISPEAVVMRPEDDRWLRA